MLREILMSSYILPLFFLGALCHAAEVSPVVQRDQLLNLGLETANLSEQALAFDLLPEGHDSLRLACVDDVLHDARRLDHWADSLALDLGECRLLSRLYERANLELTRSGHLPPVAFRETGERIGARRWRSWIDELQKLANTRLMLADTVARIEEDLRSLLREDEEQEEINVFTADSLERAGRKEWEAKVERIQQTTVPDPASLHALLLRLDHLYLDLPFLLAALEERRTTTHERFGEVYYADEWVAIGAAGPNTWTAPLPPIVIDIGGDDRYEGAVAVSRGSLAVVMDLAGNDSYRCSESPGLASTICGVSLLLDAEGNDEYVADDIALGAALGGVAMLVDHVGDDRYEGDTFVQGAGSMGVGVLVDSEGNDSYTACANAQAFGHIGGMGLLRDAEGNDVYLLRPRYLDVIRYEDHYVTLGQGFAIGVRPDLSGGIGLLVDEAGGDLYTSDIYGQGSAYWWSLGALVDRQGNDRYISYQYAQGAGIHLAAGLLLDGAGDDVYVSRGVSQGCGHDLGLGWLADDGGNDNYVCWDLSQAAGSANGTGVLTDLSGWDVYAARKDNVHGYGNPRRNSGSLGLFLEAGGPDGYLGVGQADSLWRFSRRGFGLALSDELRAELGADPEPQVVEESSWNPNLADMGAELDELFDSLDTVDHLYVWSIRLEPRWALEKTIAKRQLKARGSELLDFMVRERILDSRRSWERHAIKDLLLEQGADALPFLSSVLDTASAGARSMALWVLSLEEEVGDCDLFLSLLEDSLVQARAGLRATVLENIAVRAGGDKEALDVLVEALADEDADVRRASAWGLGKVETDPHARLTLLRTLGDTSLIVRTATRLSLERDSLLGSREVLNEVTAQEENRVLRRELLSLYAARWPELARDLVLRMPEDPALELERVFLRRELDLEPVPASGERE